MVEESGRQHPTMEGTEMTTAIHDDISESLAAECAVGIARALSRPAGGPKVVSTVKQEIFGALRTAARENAESAQLAMMSPLMREHLLKAEST
jgi:hypothetical protein